MIAEQTKYRVAKDEGWLGAAMEERGDYLIIPCRRGGKIYKHSAALLGYLSPPGRKTKLLPRLTMFGCKVHQQGDFEFSVLFPPAMLDRVAGIVGARRRPNLSGAQRIAMGDRMRKLRSKTLKKAH